MKDSEELDQSLRDKLRAAAEAEPMPEVSPQLEAQIVAALLREGRALSKPKRALWRASEDRRSGARWTWPLAAAAAVLLFGWWQLRDAPQATTQPTEHARCALPSAVSAIRDGEGRQHVHLGRFGELVATEDSVLSIGAGNACELTVNLAHGLLAGELTNLRPASLRVHTPRGDVLVRGTRFSVEANAALEVVLLSGRVEIWHGEQLTLEPRHVFRKAASDAGGISDARPEQAARIRALLEKRTAAPATVEKKEAAVVTEPVVVDPRGSAREQDQEARNPEARLSSAALLARAESERRRGNANRARQLYEQAAAQNDENGEVALLRWVRLELHTRQQTRASELLASHSVRFAGGKLKAEAAWLGIALQRERGDRAGAAQLARALIERFPKTPQAEAARALLSSP